jgi:hypothetical protein
MISYRIVLFRILSYNYIISYRKNNTIRYEIINKFVLIGIVAWFVGVFVSYYFILFQSYRIVKTIRYDTIEMDIVGLG